MKKKVSTKPKEKNNKEKSQNKGNIEIFGIILFLFGFFMSVSLLGYDTGIVGSMLSDAAHVIFGIAAFLVAVCFVLMGAIYMFTGTSISFNAHRVLVVILFWSVLAMYHHMMTSLGQELEIDSLMYYGGIISGAPVWFIHLLIGNIGTTLFLGGFIFVDILLLTRWSLSGNAKKIGAKTEEKIKKVKHKIENTRQEYREKQKENSTYNLRDFIFKKKNHKTQKDEIDVIPTEENPYEVNEMSDTENKDNEKTEKLYLNDAIEPEIAQNKNTNSEDIKTITTEGVTTPNNGSKADTEKTSEDLHVSAYQFPPLSLLHQGDAESSTNIDSGNKAERLETTLKSFGVNATIRNVSVGPSVTRYELEPAPGVRVSKIEGLADDIALQLAATSIRIEAPIPGKSAVGIEIPNAHKAAVPLYDVLSSSKFQKGKGKILVALGKDISGRTVVTDLAQMPHLLIAGQTGSGKSVCINTLITSILYHSRPDEVKMILIDPKVVELSVYNGIPHLRIEVVTHPKKAAGALNWAVHEMEARYQSFSEYNVRDISGFNKQHPETKMPYIVVIIDELADLMMVAKDSVEDSICRLAQKARAAGIHLVVATQRPSVDVITGLIKANIPSRISFAVSSQVDSRTILDKAGAEKLLGKGDMLFDPSGSPNPIRIQGAFISDEEVEAVVNYLKTISKSQDLPKEEEEEIDLSLPEKSEETISLTETDDLLDEAAEWILDTKRASVSALQRRFRIGYTRAGRLIDTMELLGIIGPAEGSKPRDILITKEQLSDIFNKSSDVKDK